MNFIVNNKIRPTGKETCKETSMRASEEVIVFFYENKQ